MTTQQASPYERMQQQAIADRNEWAQVKETALHQEYAMVRVSPRRFAVIRRMSISRTSGFVMASWEQITAPLSWAEAQAEVMRLNGKGEGV